MQAIDVVSGSPWDAKLDSTSSKYREGRMPFLGQKLEFLDGRKFRFVSTSVDLVAGQTVGVSTAAAAEFADKLTVAAIGAEAVILDITGIAVLGQSSGVMAKDKLAGGFIAMTDDTGEAYQYRIKGNSVQDASAKVTIYLEQPLVVAVDATTDCVISGNAFRNVLVGTASLKVLGVALQAVPAATDSKEYFFWIQTAGPCVVAGAATLGVTCSAAAAGAVAVTAEAGSGVYEQVLGIGLATTANGQAHVWLSELC